MRRLVARVVITAAVILSACGPGLSTGYSVRDGKVYYAAGLPARTEEVAADATSFKDLDGIYARDNSKIYYAGQELRGADPSSFEVLKEGFAKDRSHVWLRDQRISGDP